MTKLLLIGGGSMGESLLAGMLRTERPPVTPDQVTVVGRTPTRPEYLRDTYGVATGELPAAAKDADVVMIVVKPYILPEVLPSLAAALRPGALVVSVVGGATTATLEAGLPEGTPVVRCQPNTPVAVGKGVIALQAGRHAGPAELELARGLVEGSGWVEVVPERLADAFTALSGSGPAYLVHFVESLVDAGVLVGMPRALAEEAAISTVEGAVALLRSRGPDFTRLKAEVTSPGGVTAAGLAELEIGAVRGSILRAVRAGHARSQELGR